MKPDRTPLTKAELAEIDARSAAATPWEWFEDEANPGCGWFPSSVGDMEFMSHAREDVRRLLAEIRRLRPREQGWPWRDVNVIIDSRATDA